MFGCYTLVLLATVFVDTATITRYGCEVNYTSAASQRPADSRKDNDYP
jgi:hypothetical protein